MEVTLFETPTPTSTIEGRCVIEDCSKPTYDGMCNPCMILFGPYVAVIESPETQEWTPELQSSEHVAAPVPVQLPAAHRRREPLPDASPEVAPEAEAG